MASSSTDLDDFNRWRDRLSVAVRAYNRNARLQTRNESEGPVASASKGMFDALFYTDFETWLKLNGVTSSVDWLYANTEPDILNAAMIIDMPALKDGIIRLSDTPLVMECVACRNEGQMILAAFQDGQNCPVCGLKNETANEVLRVMARYSTRKVR